MSLILRTTLPLYLQKPSLYLDISNCEKIIYIYITFLNKGMKQENFKIIWYLQVLTKIEITWDYFVCRVQYDFFIQRDVLQYFLFYSLSGIEWTIDRTTSRIYGGLSQGGGTNFSFFRYLKSSVGHNQATGGFYHRVKGC